MKTKKETKKSALSANKAATKRSVVKKVIVAKKAVAKKTAVKKTVSKKSVPKKVTAVNAPNHIISKTEGKTMVTNFRNNLLDLNSATPVQFSDGREFHKSLFEKLLLLDGVEKIRFYNAVDENNQHTLVITAVDSNRNDIYFKNEPMAKKQAAAQRSAAAADNDGVGDMGSQCPAYQPNVTAL